MLRTTIKIRINILVLNKFGKCLIGWPTMMVRKQGKPSMWVRGHGRCQFPAQKSSAELSPGHLPLDFLHAPPPRALPAGRRERDRQAGALWPGMKMPRGTSAHTPFARVSQWLQLKYKCCWDVPGGPAAKHLPPSAGEAGSTPGWGTEISRVVEQLSPSTTTSEPKSCN